MPWQTSVSQAGQLCLVYDHLPKEAGMLRGAHKLGGYHDRAGGKDPAAYAVGHPPCCSGDEVHEAHQSAAEETPS